MEHISNAFDWLRQEMEREEDVHDRIFRWSFLGLLAFMLVAEVLR